jgi:hypothetical protein
MAESWAERRGSFEIDYQLELGRPQEGQVGWLFALENAARVDANLAVNFVDDRPVADQSTALRQTHAMDKWSTERVPPPPTRRSR